MATVERLVEAMKSGSHGTMSFRGAPGDRTASKRMTRATGNVNGPNLQSGQS